MTTDRRNLTDDLKGRSEDDIIRLLDGNGVTLEVAIENIERDFNMGSIVRSANALGVRQIHIIGRRQWNKRGAMATDKYLHISYYDSPGVFVRDMRRRKKHIYCVDNVANALPLHATTIPAQTVLVFGSESNGVTTELLQLCDKVVEIRQQGSTRSFNVGAAAAIAMYEWWRQRQ